MKKLLLVLAVAAFSFGCKKDDGNGGNGSGLDTYLPLTDGTNWTYKSTSGGIVSTVKFTVQPNTFMFFGKNYKRALNETTIDTSYYNKTGNDYYRIFRLGSLIGDVELNILKDNVANNATWNNSKMLTGITIPGIPIPISATVNFNFSIDGKDLTKTISGKSYNSIIKVKLSISATTPLGNQDIGTGEFYFAKNIGIVEYSLNITSPLVGASAEKLEVQSYDIK